MRRFLILAVVLTALPVAAQKERWYAGVKIEEFEGSGVKPKIASGTTPPATCNLGETFWDTDHDTDGSLMVCRAADIWKEVDDDGAAGGGTMSSFDITDTDAAPILTVDDGEQIQFIGAGTVTVVAAADVSNHDVTITGSAHFVPNANPAIDHSSYVAGHGDGANCLAGEIPLGVDASGAVQGCYEPVEADIADLNHFTPTAGLSTDHGSPAVGDTDIAAGAVDGGFAGEIADGTVNGEDMAATYAGAYLTETAGSPDTLGVDTEAVTDPFTFVLEDPSVGDSGALQWSVNLAGTITTIQCSTDTGTADINIEERALATPNTAGVDVMAADLQCDSNSASQASFSNAGFDATDPLALTISATASTPGWLRVHVTYTVNDV